MRMAMQIFGDGHGMAAPTLNQRFYWLVDLNGLKGRFYSFSPGLGAQLESYEFRRPRVGEERRFGKLRFVPFQQARGYVRDPFFDLPLIPLMWRVSWRCIDLPPKATAEDVRAIEKELVY